MLCLLSRRRRTQKTETVNDNYFTATLEHEQDYSTHPPSYESVVSSSNTAKTAYSVVFSTGISDTYGQINRGGHYGTGVHNIEHIDDRLPTTIS